MKLRHVIMALPLLLISTLASGCGCTTVEPGYVGIKYSLLGEERDISQLKTFVGRVTYNGMSEAVVTFPVTVQRKEWKTDAEDSNYFQFNTKEGLQMSGDVAINIAVERDKAATIFVTYRKDAEELFEGVVKDAVRDSIVKISSKYTAESINGPNRTKFTDEVEEALRAKLSPMGFILSDFAFVGPFGMPDSIKQTINAKINANEQAAQAENELRTTRAEAAKVVAEAEGFAKATLARAKGQAEANRTIARSITKELIEYKKIEKWNGVMSPFGNTIPMVNVGMSSPAPEKEPSP